MLYATLSPTLLTLLVTMIPALFVWLFSNIADWVHKLYVKKRQEQDKSGLTVPDWIETLETFRRYVASETTEETKPRGPQL